MPMVSLTKATAEHYDEARGWISDVFGTSMTRRTAISCYSDERARKLVDMHYEGGWSAFLAHCNF